MDNTYKFEIPKQNQSIIKVIGVGGGGSNAVNHMYNQGIKDVDFIVCNTDAQALEGSPIPTKLQIGLNLTAGLGAGANPEKGKNAALESIEDIREMLSEQTRMVFITAGMGGGTGTGAAPVIARVAKEMGLLTVGIVTAPFSFEGHRKRKAAEAGIAELKDSCDTVLVILNDKLREIFGNLPVSQAFGQADDVLTTAAKGIAEIITVPGYVNVDFEDVRTVMESSGAAVMGSAKTEGENRAERAAEAAISSPLLNNKDIHGAKRILLSIISGESAELQMDELSDITEYIQAKAGDDAEVIFGHGIDPDLGDSIRVTVIATGFEVKNEKGEDTTFSIRRVYDLESKREIESKPTNTAPVENTHMGSTASSNPVSIPTNPVTLESEDQNPGEVEAPVGPENTIVTEDSFSMDEAPASEPAQGAFTSLEQKFEIEERKTEVELVEDTNSKDETQEEIEDDLEIKKHVLEEEARERILRLTANNQSSLVADDFKEKLEIPAYLRKKVRLQEVPNSSESNVSRYNLGEEDQVLGNNRFLHDNVD
ncbi:cell division protein FtsZ [Xanthovirga aplysinae]|uniref:cell division protein FtsZ n=1 Tax=Xanthovirga aplysinae TaxID=2529853 RepID=UPI0012BD2954|nr:cell division protein FtsZ [Xanthovirga aplysinae]